MLEYYDLVKQRSDSPYDSVAYRLVKPGLSELQAEAEELNQSQIVGTSIVIGLSSRSCFRLPTPTIWFSQVYKRRSHKRIRNEDGNFRILPTPILWRLWLRLRLRFLILTKS